MIKSRLIVLAVFVLLASSVLIFVPKFYAIGKEVLAIAWFSLGLFSFVGYQFCQVPINASKPNMPAWHHRPDDITRGVKRHGHMHTPSLRDHTNPHPKPSGLSAFGRIPVSTYELLAQHARDLSGPVVSYLPLRITREMRDFTVYKTLQTVLKDSLENENDEPLSADDIKDFGSFAELAFAIAVGPVRKDITKIDESVYNALLSALLDDWLQNWNADGVDGPC